MKHTLYSAVHSAFYPFEGLATHHKEVYLPEQLTQLDSFLIIWGGADISSEYYNHPRHSTTHPGGARDRVEWSLMQAAIEKGIPIIGICRGAQMACAAAGGWLIQDVQNHTVRHEVETFDGKRLPVNSLHHQMMAGLGTVMHEMVAWRPGNFGAPYGYKDNQEYKPHAAFKEAEFVYFPKIRTYAIQWHPEMMSEEAEATNYILEYIQTTEKRLSDAYCQLTV